ncbi:hypothetical protein Ahy_B06g081018 isoform A [Arachis hypogaea]|uniref:Uncharacterized protein n=1 Tax=Arachis hypogaea TaxID=3818 RepID=A0A444YJS6_ARAHY|nr:hypothetical protein Ahy_B06g081018 isoform A [Arachis hypogaea]
MGGGNGGCRHGASSHSLVPSGSHKVMFALENHTNLKLQISKSCFVIVSLKHTWLLVVRVQHLVRFFRVPRVPFKSGANKNTPTSHLAHSKPSSLQKHTLSPFSPSRITLTFANPFAHNTPSNKHSKNLPSPSHPHSRDIHPHPHSTHTRKREEI